MNSDLYYKQKYLKYKSKYLQLKKLYGGNESCGTVDDEICKQLKEMGFTDTYIQLGEILRNKYQYKYKKLIELKNNGFTNFSSYNAVSNNLDDNKIEQMKNLKKIGFTEDIPYNAVYKLSEAQIEKMIFIKENGFTDKFAYSYVNGDDVIRKIEELSNNKKRFKNIPIKQFINIEKEKEMFKLKQQGKSDQDAYQDALNYNPPT